MIEKFLLSLWVPILLALVLLIEAILLTWLWRRYKVGIPLKNAWPFLFSGLFFSLALYAMVFPQKSWLVALALIGAFFSHIIDIKERWRR